MGKQLLRPKMLLEKTVEALLTTATQHTVRAKKLVVQEEVSTFTSTVITRKTVSITMREDRILTLAGTLGTRGRSLCFKPQREGSGREHISCAGRGVKKTKRGGRRRGSSRQGAGI